MTYYGTYLDSSLVNMTLDDINQNVAPFWIYTYTVCLIPVFVLTDLLRCATFLRKTFRKSCCTLALSSLLFARMFRYIPLIVLRSLGLIADGFMLIFGRELWVFELESAIAGLTASCLTAYYAYIYSIVDEKHYKRVSCLVYKRLPIHHTSHFNLPTGG